MPSINYKITNKSIFSELSRLRSARSGNIWINKLLLKQANVQEASSTLHVSQTGIRLFLFFKPEIVLLISLIRLQQVLHSVSIVMLHIRTVPNK